MRSEIVGLRGGGGAFGVAELPSMVKAIRGASSWSPSSIGKGLKEPCSPYREAYVFGAELNVPDADGWNCPPEIVEPTTVFDLSTITPNHEVVVALYVIRNLYNGLTVYWKWCRDNILLFDFPWSIPDPRDYGYEYWIWYYVYCYIGYVPWEIYENGNYHVDTIAGSFSKRLDFTVKGIGVTAEFNNLIATYRRG